LAPEYAYTLKETAQSAIFKFNQEPPKYNPIAFSTVFGNLLVYPLDSSVVPSCAQDLTITYPYILHCKGAYKIQVVPSAGYTFSLLGTSSVKFELLQRSKPISVLPLSTSATGVGSLVAFHTPGDICIFDGANAVGLDALTGWSTSSAGSWGFTIDTLTLEHSVKENTFISDGFVKAGEVLNTYVISDTDTRVLKDNFTKHYLLKVSRGVTIGFNTVQKFFLGLSGRLDLTFIPSYSVYTAITIAISTDYDIARNPGSIVKSSTLTFEDRVKTLPELVVSEPTGYSILHTGYWQYTVTVDLQDVPLDYYYITVMSKTGKDLVEFRVSSIYIRQVFVHEPSGLTSGFDNVLHFLSPSSAGVLVSRYIDFSEYTWTLEIFLNSYCNNCNIFNTLFGVSANYVYKNGKKFVTVSYGNNLIQESVYFPSGIDYVAISCNRGMLYINGINTRVASFNFKNDLIHLGKGNFSGWFKGLKFTKAFVNSATTIVDSHNQATFDRLSRVLSYDTSAVDLVVCYDDT
jgi:hypothetical protein